MLDTPPQRLETRPQNERTNFLTMVLMPARKLIHGRAVTAPAPEHEPPAGERRMAARREP